MKRRLALGAAIVVATTAIGLAVSASPAAAAPNCQLWRTQSKNAALLMDYYLGRDYWAWSGFYDFWLDAEAQLEANNC